MVEPTKVACWICVEYIPCYDKFAAGGSLTIGGCPPLCYIYDLRNAIAEYEAKLMAMEFAIQVVLEDVSCVEKDLQLKI